MEDGAPGPQPHREEISAGDVGMWVSMQLFLLCYGTAAVVVHGVLVTAYVNQSAGMTDADSGQGVRHAVRLLLFLCIIATGWRVVETPRQGVPVFRPQF